MSVYSYYRIGQWVATRFPRAVAYRVAVAVADVQYRRATSDREAVQRNLSAILGPDNPEISSVAREAFRNFAKYLIDFFRLGEVDARFLREHVTMVNRRYLDEALRQGHGAIALSAHLGNYELGAAVMAAAGYRVNTVVLTHQDPRIDALFRLQRLAGGVHPIPVGIALRQVFACLNRNELLGILADRDFFNNGIRLEFLGRQMSIPKGPALFSLRTGAVIVPTFLIRAPRNRFEMIFETPIYPQPTDNEPDDVKRITQQALQVLERYIRRYPSQWYLFRDFWEAGPWAIQ